MSESNNFLKFLLTDEVYVIDEQLEPSPITQKVVDKVDVKPETKEVILSPKQDNLKVESVSTPTSEILVLFSNADDDHLHTEESSFLQKILSAVKMDINKVDLINVEKKDSNPTLYKKVIAFTSQHGLPANNKYQLSVSDQTVLLADDLSAISSSVDLKKKLWAELQKMFG